MTSASGLSTVACVAITKNEEHNLPDCRQFVHWVGEGAVIDADSSDRTAHLARGGGAKEGNRRNARKLTQACLQTVSLLEDIQPISRAWGMIMPCSSPHYLWRFVAKLLSRVVRPARRAVRTRDVLVQYGEGPRGEPAGRRLVVAADRRLQQKCS